MHVSSSSYDMHVSSSSYDMHVSSSSYDMHVSFSSGSELHVKQGKLNLVDLAGSERQGKTGSTGLGFRVEGLV
jgi:hypothetical protein